MIENKSEYIVMKVNNQITPLHEEQITTLKLGKADYGDAPNVQRQAAASRSTRPLIRVQQGWSGAVPTSTLTSPPMTREKKRMFSKRNRTVDAEFLEPILNSCCLMVTLYQDSPCITSLKNHGNMASKGEIIVRG
ncbi:hypothetical protein FRX31_035261 [Thalictrum thalictroides]|uniref:Uncharacterized protein n=1 Tax=Thalictrum thalictroides TaxID=46969 RepID=A0A7J6URR7_THATH|nr:hypothetical protein FRX31_035261 [Thalictrum thalictroides]